MIFCALFALIATFSYSQVPHMTFMNIPLDGNIHNFVSMLTKKNFIIRDSVLNHVRMSGTFLNVDAFIFVRYNPKDNKVYNVEVSVEKHVLNPIRFYEFEELYNVKYGKGTEEIKYSLDDWTRNLVTIWQSQLGNIKMTYRSYSKSISIEYFDNINYKSYIKQNMDYNGI